MANNIGLFKKYIALLDEVYKAASKTSELDTAEVAQMSASTGEFIIPKMDMDGLADYGRSGGGYVDGGVTLTYQTKRPDYDRGRSFNVDAMDNEESAGIAFGRLAGEFIRTKVVPELDAYRFAKYSAKAGTSVTASIAAAEALPPALSKAVTTMREKEVDEAGLYLFITSTLAQMMRDLDSYKSKEVMSAFTRTVEVPQSRFVTAIELHDGTSTGKEAGGWAKASGAKDINFMIVSKRALLQLTKHTVNKIFSPAENQLADAWRFCYRAYGIAETYDNKADGIYLHMKPSA